MIGYSGQRYDRLHIFELGGVRARDAREDGPAIITGAHWRFAVTAEAVCTAESAARILALWDALPPGQTARCHTPGYALRLILDGDAVFTAAVCWHCNNISIAGSMATIDWRLFDAHSPAARMLLEMCRTMF